MRSSTPNVISSHRATKKSPIRQQRVRTTPAKKPSHLQQQIQKHQHKIVAILLGTLSLATFLAIVSYSPYDATLTMLSFRDVWKLLLGDPQLQALVETTHNWLGIVGAIIADFLINQLIGYSALAIPVLLGIWAYWIWQQNIPSKLLFHTGITLSTALLIATTFGVLNLATAALSLEWSGAVGEFLAHILRSLFGIVGAFLILTALGFLIGLLVAGERLSSRIQRQLQQARRWLQANLSSLARKKPQVPEAAPSAPSRTPQSPAQSVEPEEEPARRIRQKLEQEVVIQRPEQTSNFSESPVTSSSDSQKSTTRTTPSPDTKPSRTLRAKPSTPPAPAARPLKLDVTPQKAEETVPDKTFVDTHPLDEPITYNPPTIDLLDPPEEISAVDEEELRRNAEILREKLRTFKVEIENITVTPGPVVTQYEFVPAAGIKVSQIESLADDIALALKARGIRIIAPVPGKGTVAVEIPNHQPAIVRFSEIIRSPKFKNANYQLPIALGKTTIGEIFVTDLAQMPHLLIAGATGSGKSVGINVIIASLLFKMHPRYLKFLIIDPKKVELTPYRKLKNHFLAVCPDTPEPILTTPEHAIAGLRSVELEMERRYDLLAKAGQRNIQDYNRKVREKKLPASDEIIHRELPYIVVIIDELADLMMTASKEVEEPITRLAQLARAVGIHLVVATQRPSVDVITGLIKANFPARIAYQVATKVDSRTILDMNGAEQLIGRGDMLLMTGSSPKPIRLQNAFLSIDEVEAICDFISSQPGYSQPYTLPSLAEKHKEELLGGTGERDELFEIAARIVVQHQQGSVSLLQRRLKIGYARAARIMDQLEEAGIVGPFEGSKARSVYIQNEEELQQYLSRS